MQTVYARGSGSGSHFETFILIYIFDFQPIYSK